MLFCFVDVVLSALDNMGFVANMVSLVLYFYGVMHFDLSSSANTLTNFMGSTFLLSLVGEFISILKYLFE
jgi:peptide/histidine transporter 3/4